MSRTRKYTPPYVHGKKQDIYKLVKLETSSNEQEALILPGEILWGLNQFLLCDKVSYPPFMTPEKNIDQYTEAQRESELAWIDQNSPLFSTKTAGYFGLVGRGAIIVDAATKPLSEGPLYTYFSKEQMEHIADDDINEMVDDYDPATEFVVLLLLPENQTRAYRIDIPVKEGLLAGESGFVEYAGT